jgi:hypothetical protein
VPSALALTRCPSGSAITTATCTTPERRQIAAPTANADPDISSIGPVHDGSAHASWPAAVSCAASDSLASTSKPLFSSSPRMTPFTSALCAADRSASPPTGKSTQRLAQAPAAVMITG